MFQRRNHGRDTTPLAPDQDSPKKLNRDNLRAYRRILRYVIPYRFWFTISIIALLFSVLLGLLLPLVIQSLVDIVLVDKNLALLNQLAIGLLIVFIVQAIFSFIHRLSLAYVGEHAIADIRQEVYQPPDAPLPQLL
jgi:ATP-binding cassette, subfamily B, bacterial MsbA